MLNNFILQELLKTFLGQNVRHHENMFKLCLRQNLATNKPGFSVSNVNGNNISAKCSC